jgi:hypothetical protein
MPGGKPRHNTLYTGLQLRWQESYAGSHHQRIGESVA